MGKGDPKGGRPALLETNPEIHDTIVGLIQEGNFNQVAAAFAGVSNDTFCRWIRQGKRDRRSGQDTVYARFSEAIEKADATDEIWHNRNIRQAAQTQWQASAWHQERKRPERWGKREHVEHSGGVKITREYIGADRDDL